MKILQTILAAVALACHCTVTNAGAANVIAAPVQCFDDWRSVSWGANEQGQRAQMLLMCAQVGASVLAVLDAVDRGRVPETRAGQTARELAFTVVAGALTEVDGGYQDRAQRAPTPDNFRTYISDDISMLRTQLPYVQSLVSSAWWDPKLASTPYPGASKRIVAQWVAAH